jgi:hypothetical protein
MGQALLAGAKLPIRAISLVAGFVGGNGLGRLDNYLS